MSTWIEIEKQEDVDFCHWDSIIIGEDSIDVLYSQDKFGANYVSIPVKFILSVLEANGYEINEKD
jgi:hypothetical protein